MRIPKNWKSTKGALRRPCVSSASTWQTTNLYTLKVAKNRRGMKEPLLQFFTYNMQEDEIVLDHINKLKMFVD